MRLCELHYSANGDHRLKHREQSEVQYLGLYDVEPTVAVSLQKVQALQSVAHQMATFEPIGDTETWIRRGFQRFLPAEGFCHTRFDTIRLRLRPSLFTQLLAH